MVSLEKVVAPVSNRRICTKRAVLVTLMCFAMVAGAAAPSSATDTRHGSSRGDAPEFDERPVAATSAPSITIVEDAVPNASQDFPFSGCQGASCSVFALDDDADPALPNTVSASGLTAGTYTITQAPGVNHWALDDIFCDTGENVDVENRTVTITLGATEDVTCTFLNRSPSIRIIEDATPNAPKDFSFTGCQGAGCGTFVLDDDTDPVLSNSVTASGLAPGTYTITQAPAASWSLTGLSCNTAENIDRANGRVTITLDPGEFVRCTFSNATPGIVIVQDTVPDGPQDFGFSGCLGSGCGQFSLDDDTDSTLPNAVTGVELAPGDYTVTQDVTPGFDLLDISCETSDGGSQSFDPMSRQIDFGVGGGPYSRTCTFLNRPSPPPLTGVAQISAGFSFTCARLTNGEVRCWGANYYGQIASGSTEDVLSTPAAVVNPTGTGPLTDVVQVSVGSHACAVLNNGEGRCWGWSSNGTLGNGSLANFTATQPVVVLNTSGTGPLTDIAQISAGSSHTCARLTNGEARCWGNNTFGQLGNGTTTRSALPVVVSNPDGTGPLTDVAQISVDGEDTCARLTGGEARCWGRNTSGQLGVGAVDNNPHSRPEVVKNTTGTGPLTGVVQIAAGNAHTCARVGRQARCWGANYHGQVGDGTPQDDARPLPVPVLDTSGEAPLTNIADIVAHSQTSCARLFSGEARCWGYGPLGNGDGGGWRSNVPVAVANSAGTGPITDIAQVSFGGEHGCVRLTSGEARCWGQGYDGQTGNGTPAVGIPGHFWQRPVVVISP